MVGESKKVFTKRVLVEKHISGIMRKNPGRPRPPLKGVGRKISREGGNEKNTEK